MSYEGADTGSAVFPAGPRNERSDVACECKGPRLGHLRVAILAVAQQDAVRHEPHLAEG